MTAPSPEVANAVVNACAEAAYATSRKHGFGGALPGACAITAGVELLRHDGQSAKQIADWLRLEADRLETDALIGPTEGCA